MTTHYESLFIGGKWVPPTSAATIDVISASTEEQIGSVPRGMAADADAAVSAARAAFDDVQGWSRWSPQQRAEAMNRFADELEGRAEETVRRVSGQNGMPVSVGQQTEAVYPATLLRFYANVALTQATEETRTSLVAGTTVVRREPIGVVAAIVPWNFPQSLTFFKVAPALAAGCTVVLKPSSETVLDAFLVAEAAAAAGLPDGVLNIVTGSGREVGMRLVSSPGVDKVAFTGSTDAGRTIAEECGRLLRPVTLELGGKSAAILLDDVDLAANMKSFYGSMLLNQGQTCFISTRILAPRNRYSEVVEAFTALAKGLPVGDPFDPRTMIGPLATSAQRDSVEGYIAQGIAEGGRVTAGGKRPKCLDRGWYVEPTIFADVDNAATIAREEIFGPVLAVIPYEDEEDAIAIANDSDYGLGGTVWTSDQDHGLAVARRIQTGS
ncbi:MAG TPA: aldehyde dehydrogenase, partial [Nocardioidaceae bacterium]|nr:aldehyde dehydrogenase [Nocardioidaceae bacterium]